MAARNTRTNGMLETLSQILDKNGDQEQDITLNVDGQLITGTAISESLFFAMEQNLLFSKMQEDIKKVRSNIFDESTFNPKSDFTPETIKEIPDQYFQQTLYLKDAHFVMSNGVMIPTSGTSMQIRISDISCFVIGRLNSIN